jgi:hypothetical protein
MTDPRPFDERAYELCLEIEKLPASDQQTRVSGLASDLHRDLAHTHVPASWLPTPDAIDTLPLPLRKFIHDLQTRADPSGEVAELTIARETCRALSLRVEELEREIAALRGGSR